MRAGELETEPGQKRLHQLIVASAGQGPCLRLKFFPPEPDLNLQFDELIQGQPLARNFHVRQFLREMRHVNGIRSVEDGRARRPLRAVASLRKTARTE